MINKLHALNSFNKSSKCVLYRMVRASAYAFTYTRKLYIAFA